MSFIAKNPLTAPIISKQPSSPPIGARGLFASEDGWYDVNSNGVTEKIATNTSLAGKVDKVNGKGLSTEDYTTTEKEKLASLSNYDDSNLVNALANKVDKSAITTVVQYESTDEQIPTAKATWQAVDNAVSFLDRKITDTEISINQINETITTKTNTTVPETLAINTIYDLGEQTSLTLNLPSGKLGDFIQVDFLSTATPTTLTITATSGLSDYDLIPEANTIYSLYFNWIRLDATTYGWGFGYAEYTRTVA